MVPVFPECCSKCCGLKNCRGREGGEKKKKKKSPGACWSKLNLQSPPVATATKEWVGGWRGWGGGVGVVVVVNVFNADSGEDSIPGKIAIKLRLFEGVN